MEMTSTEELGLVWMGDMVLHGGDPTGGLMINSNIDPNRHTFFPEAQQPIDEIHQPTTPMQYVQDMNGFLMLDEFEDPYFEEAGDDDLQKCVQTAATQTGAGSVNPSRKIKPVRHPGLKLQTPIAYQRDTDINVIPIQRDGMAVCEKCGAIGVKHAFYTRERRFCSLACARGSSETQQLQDEGDDLNSQKMELDPVADVKPKIPSTPTLPPPPPPLPEEDPPFPPDKKSQVHLSGTYEWTELLSSPEFNASPAPMANSWDNITVGMKVEVENTDCDNYSEEVPDSFWVATVLRIAGYKALLRYEGFGQNESKDFWVNLCSSQVHPVGWCATRGKPLIPPKTIQDKYKDWKHFLVKRLTGARTLPSNFFTKVQENMKSRFRCDLNLEVVDKNRISQVKVATIKHIVGKRLHVKYYDADPGDNGFWAHEDSPLIHPVGWAKRVGQTLAAPPVYVDRCLKGLRDKDDATEDLFPFYNCLPYRSGFQRGMKLEAVDPLNLSTICVASVMKVLNDGYLMIRIDSYDEDALSPGSDWFCYHSSSACILPPGYCELNGIKLTPPNGHDPQSFEWSQYLNDTGSIPAPIELFDMEPPEHEFAIGQKLEATDLMDPRLVCVATITQIVGRLIRVHFDGWEEDYDQWLDCQSPDIYPVGWCQLVSHKLEGPHNPLKPSPPQKSKDGKPHKRRRGRRGWQRRNLQGKMSDKIENGDAKPSALSSDGSNMSSSSLAESNPVSVSSPITNTPSLSSQPKKPSGDMVDTSKGFTPEMGEVPTGPDQALPEEPRPIENNAHPKETTMSKIIPRLSSVTGVDISKVNPGEWDESDVATFLRINGCATYCDSFSSSKINGKTLLNLTKDQIIDLTGMKVGPSLKIYDLIQQLKLKVNPAQERLKSVYKKLL